MIQFHPEEAINNPSILDEIFTEMNAAYKKGMVPMTEEQSNYTIHIMMATDEGIEKMYKEIGDTFPIGGFFKRCGIFPIKYSKKLQLWLGLTTFEFGIGGMILIGYYLQWWAFHQAEKQMTVKNEIELGELSMDTVVEKCFPFGLFTQEIVHEFWDKQKVKARPDNLVDHHSAALSFMPKTEGVES
jgi:beta-glucosidase/6-phospho-beta-glucosidase/beta-galactosidase